MIGREFDLGTLGPLSALATDRLPGLLEEAIGARVLEEPTARSAATAWALITGSTAGLRVRPA